MQFFFLEKKVPAGGNVEGSEESDGPLVQTSAACKGGMHTCAVYRVPSECLTTRNEALMEAAILRTRNTSYRDEALIIPVPAADTRPHKPGVSGVKMPMVENNEQNTAHVIGTREVKVKNGCQSYWNRKEEKQTGEVLP